jgi:hypothetical protein
VIRQGGWIAGSGRYGWPRPARPRPVPAGPGMSGSTGHRSSPRIRSRPVMRCGCARKDANASWSSPGLSPSGPAPPWPPSATSTTARPRRGARRGSRSRRASAAPAVRPSASAAVSTSCSDGRPADLRSADLEPVADLAVGQAVGTSKASAYAAAKLGWASPGRHRDLSAERRDPGGHRACARQPAACLLRLTRYGWGEAGPARRTVPLARACCHGKTGVL